MDLLNLVDLMDLANLGILIILVNLVILVVRIPWDRKFLRIGISFRVLAGSTEVYIYARLSQTPGSVRLGSYRFIHFLCTVIGNII